MFRISSAIDEGSAPSELGLYVMTTSQASIEACAYENSGRRESRPIDDRRSTSDSARPANHVGRFMGMARGRRLGRRLTPFKATNEERSTSGVPRLPAPLRVQR